MIPIPPALFGLAVKFIAVASLVGVGFFAGLSWSADEHKKEILKQQEIYQEKETKREQEFIRQKDALIKAYTESVQNAVNEANRRNTAVVEAIHFDYQEQNKTKTAVITRLRKQLEAERGKVHVVYQDSDGNTIQSTPSTVGDFLFDVGTVSLLNAARANQPAPAADVSTTDSASGSDEALSAPSTVGLVEFVENDLAVVRLYHELARRHDALVDYIEAKQKEYNK